jgi:2-(1,2-epoxy-1,2-dihydrophenyl)acetyl-CoA isomerase
MSSVEALNVERHDGVVTVTMNRPEKKNAANGMMFEELLAIFREIKGSPGDRCMVLTGAEGNFCTGADLSDSRGATMDLGIPAIVRMRRLNEVAISLYDLPIPTIAKVDGMAVGAGMSLALGCDLLIAAETARFSMIFSRRGLSPDMGASWLLPRRVGEAKAKELMLLADIIDAAEGERLGFVNRVIPTADLDHEVADLAQRLATGPSLAYGLTKTLIHESSTASFAQSLESEGRAQALNFASEDTIEAMRAFLEKRDPNFKGR